MKKVIKIVSAAPQVVIEKMGSRVLVQVRDEEGVSSVVVDLDEARSIMDAIQSVMDEIVVDLHDMGDYE